MTMNETLLLLFAFLFVKSSLAVTQYSRKNCPYGFLSLPGAEDCYKAVLTRLNWDDSRMKCSKLNPNAHLAVIDNEAEDAAIREYLKSLNSTDTYPCRFMEKTGTAGFFTSGQQAQPGNCSSPYVWRPQPEGEDIPLTYRNWAPNEPNCFNRQTENCLHYWSEYDYQWNDLSCLKEGCPLCQLVRS
jgi:hypothetical protein